MYDVDAMQKFEGERMGGKSIYIPKLCLLTLMLTLLFEIHINVYMLMFIAL